MKRTFLTVMVVVIVASILLIIVKWWKAIPPIIGGWNFAILNLLELVGPVIALSLASFILYQFIRHFFRPQLIFEGFSNASNLDKSSAGLKMMSFNELTLEELSNQSKILSKMWNQSDGVLLEDRSWKNRIPINFINDDSVISRLSRTDIFDWIRSSEDKVPQGFAFIMSFMSFVGDTIAPIIKIAGHLQYRSDNRAGITLEVADTKKPGNYTIYTFWQDEVSVADKIVDSYIT